MIAPSLHPKQILLGLCFFMFLAGRAQTAADSLIAFADGNLYKVNKNDAGASLYLNISNFPNFDPFSLDWSESQQAYYGIEVPLGNSVFKISESGVYSTLGPVNVPGFTISTMEGIAFNPVDNYLYVSVSLNGGPSQGDYCSESLVKVNLANMQGQVIGTFSHPLTNALEPEADAIEFDEQGMLYYFDCSVSSDSRIFKQDPAFLNPPVLLNQTGYQSLSDLTVKDNQVFITTSGPYNLQNCSVNGGPLQQTAISPNALFNGALLRGITWKPACDQEPIAAFSALGTTTGLPGLEVSFSNSSQNATSFLFQFIPGLTTATNDVTEIVSATFNQPGIYPVILTAFNDGCSDTSMIYVFIIEPIDVPDSVTSVVLPNSFTPNGDGINEVFFLDFPNATDLNIRIFNRWGNQVVELDGLNQKWDGKVKGDPVSDGVYFYTYKVRFKNSPQVTGNGFLTLIR